MVGPPEGMMDKGPWGAVPQASFTLTVVTVTTFPSLNVFIPDFILLVLTHFSR